MRSVPVVPLAALALFLAASAAAQSFSQRGFLEFESFGFPQTAPMDSSHATAEALLRYEAFYKPGSAWQFAGAFDARTDTHREDERLLHLSWWDRETRRPAFAVRRLSATYNRGPVTVEVGKQFIRWGKADILNPTDRFAPRDFLNVIDNEFLAVPAARLTVERDSETVDVVWQARFAPARIPLLNQRWVVLPENPPAGLRIVDGGARYPGGSEFGGRWNHNGAGYEFSLSFYDGFNYLPLLAVSPWRDPLTSGSGTTPPESSGVPPPPPAVAFERFYPQMRMYGGDAAVPLRPFTIKGEAAWFSSTNAKADDYAIYVIEFEKQRGEWSFTGGYAGEAVTRNRSALSFSYDRGLARAFLGHASYTIGPTRSVAFETAVRQNGKGVWLKSEYSQSFGQHWRATAGFTLMRGAREDFLGQYRRNSHALLAFRYSF